MQDSQHFQYHRNVALPLAVMWIKKLLDITLKQIKISSSNTDATQSVLKVHSPKIDEGNAF